MKTTMRNVLIAVTVAMLAVGTSACKRADNSSDAGTPGAASGAMGPASGPAVASGASQ